MRSLIRSLARNTSTVVNKKTIIKDIKENDSVEETIENTQTVEDYLDVLERLHLIENEEAYSENYRSPNRIDSNTKPNVFK